MLRRQAVGGMGCDGLPKHGGRDHAKHGLPARYWEMHFMPQDAPSR
eukprot:COSAG01_NODE_65_length_29252_cov_173.296995_23_plen_46_part_00